MCTAAAGAGGRIQRIGIDIPPAAIVWKGSSDASPDEDAPAEH